MFSWVLGVIDWITEPEMELWEAMNLSSAGQKDEEPRKLIGGWHRKRRQCCGTQTLRLWGLRWRQMVTVTAEWVSGYQLLLENQKLVTVGRKRPRYSLVSVRLSTCLLWILWLLNFSASCPMPKIGKWFKGKSSSKTVSSLLLRFSSLSSLGLPPASSLQSFPFLTRLVLLLVCFL